MTNPVLNAFAARNDSDEPVADWLYAVEEHIRDLTLFTEFEEDGELRLSVYQTIKDLNPTAEDLEEARQLLAAFAAVLHDQRQSDDDDFTDGQLLHYVRDIVTLPDAERVLGALPLDDDGTELTAAYVTVLKADPEIIGGDFYV